MEVDRSLNKEQILLVDKPAGWTSFDVCAKLRGQIRAEYRQRGEKPTKRQLRVGHAGTLDPFATGLLIVLLGESTKQADRFVKLDKVYEATVRLGQNSSTGDPEGELSDISRHQPSQPEVEAACRQLLGKISQTPPAYSAIKINGQRAYKLARAGKEVQMPARQVEIFSIEVLAYNYPDVRIRAHVSSGTYIRSLAEDIGRILSTGAYCYELRRSQIGSYSVSDSRVLSDLKKAVQ